MLVPLEFPYDTKWYIPSKEECFRLWDTYHVLPQIREHCLTVSKVGMLLVELLESKGYEMNKPLVHAACLLHDIAKSYTLHYGGEHAQIGSAWILQETGNPALAQAILFHVYWPWKNGDLAIENNPLRIPSILSYADKRVCHNKVVGLQARCADILTRYGTTDLRRQTIKENFQQTKNLENALVHILGDLKILEDIL